MGVIGAFDREKDLDELTVPVDVGSGIRSVATRQANAIANLGLTDTIAQLNLLAGATPGVVVDSIAAIYNAAGGLAMSSATPAAAGSTQTNSTALTAELNAVTGADGTKGVVLPTAVVDTPIFVINTSPTNPLPVWPASGAAINSLSANAAFSLGPGLAATFVGRSATQWYVAVQNSGFFTPAAGTATSAPLTFTAGTNLTAATAGAVEFDGTAFYATAIAASRQQLDAEQLVIAAANSATYNNTGLDTNAAAPVFTATTNPTLTAGAVTLAAGKQYAFEALFNLTNTGTTSHTWAALFGGTATFSAGTNVQGAGNSSGTANAAASGGLTGFTTTPGTALVLTPASTSATEQATFTLSGIIVVNAGGTLIPQLKASARPGASGTPGVTVLAGSFFRIWEMNTTGVVGDWS